MLRTRSDQLLEMAAAAALKSPDSSGGEGLRRKASSPRRSTHIRKWRSMQMKHELEELSSGVALSRAASASLALPFSFTGFTVPPPDNVPADSELPFTDVDDDNGSKDLEAGRDKKKIIDSGPTLPIFLKFSEISYKVVVKGTRCKGEKEILNGISGGVDPGEVLALMGPSGSGKTTLLTILGGRNKRGPTPGGSITYNDQPYSKLLKSRIGFVSQDDILFPHLTVRETLTYAARLRLPKTLTREEKERRAMDVICELGLERCQDTMVGGSSFVRGVSGGERKRVCIGNEIILNPSLLFLDEPTSGLDSTTALKIVDILHDIAQVGKTVITTIHQPSSRLFLKFDKLILLSKGSLLYFGKASSAMDYFSSIGCAPLIAMNPAEFLLDLANGNVNDVSVPSKLNDKVQMGNYMRQTKDGRPSISVMHEYLVESYETRIAESEKKKLLAPLPIDEELKSKVSSIKREWGASWWEQFSILFWRGLKERKHDYFSWLRITQVIATALILGMLWWQSGGDHNPTQLQDQAGLLFFIAVFWGFFPVFTAIFTFPQERAMLNKERAADMYRLSAYFVARTTSDLPLDLFLPLLFIVVVYLMAGLKSDAASFFLTVLTVFLCIVAAQGLGLAIGATLMDLKRATTVASVTVMTFMLAGGYFIQRVPEFIAWLRYLSFNYHTFKLLLKVQYGDITNSVNGIKIDTGFKEVSALAAMVVAYRLLAYISLRLTRINEPSF
ncbi:unnamed protein product [Cuscuta europaea]|uniref:ABC transporter domain-containing protein n=1 Tax=Cuscuta europaea TaxID=41803 RepID=A0A9P1EMN9_CUSEU|nr:unnamed protein product [Cuscuta europaea]